MKNPVIQFGLETEVGIAREGAENLDVVAESIALVRSAVERGVRMRWDYSAENPHRDMRGFDVAELRQDSDEVRYLACDSGRDLSYVEIKSDLVLGNGARLYNDHAHPEFSTPECSTLDELVAYDRAGEYILNGCARRLSRKQGATVRLYKNNTDFMGHSYGCHENYLLPRSLSWENLVKAMLPFLATRQVYAGAGKFAVEAEDQFVAPAFQISQRSDFFSELQSVDTMQHRPLINTRDEPHASAQHFRRFHVIIGDANMSPFATRLKVGATLLVLEAVVRDPMRSFPVLQDPLAALHEVSLDPCFRWEVRLEGGRPSTALAVQRVYLEAVRKVCDLNAPWKAAVVADWAAVLNDLETDYRRCRDRLDWVAKLALIREFQAVHRVSDADPWLQSLDLEYHRLDPAAGLYYAWERAGAVRGVPDEALVKRAIAEPPRTTRAYVRGRCIQKFAEAVVAAQWDYVSLRGRRGVLRISLADLFAPEQVMRYARIVDEAQTPDDLDAIAE
jgi:proteasome accessory factor A